MTRIRGYLCLAAVLLLVALVVVLLDWRDGVGTKAGSVNKAVIDSLDCALPEIGTKGQDSLCSGAAKKKSNVKRGVCPPKERDDRDGRPRPVSPPEQVFRKSKRVVVDLNSADSMDLVQLYNVGPAFAKRILGYRVRLGGFVSKEQLWEVYGMDSVRYNDIVPYVTVNPEEINTIDINTATIDQLKHHPYLDYYQAKAIVRMREQVGRYDDAADIGTIPIIDEETYSKIIPYLTCSSQQSK